jgi:TolA-binding protein
VQGKQLATQVTTLRKAAEVSAAELETLQKQQDEDKASAAELQAQLAEAEEEIAVLRLQAERAAILEVQSEISSRLVEDLQVHIRPALAEGSMCVRCTGCAPWRCMHCLRSQ